MSVKKRILLGAFSSICILPISEGFAQSVDYKGLESLYGEPITTSANGSPQRQSEVFLNMEILTAEDIERSGARSIPEALRFLPGLNVTQKTFGQTEVSIRGYNQNNAERILVLLNGRQVYTDFFGQVVWDNIPVEISEIKQIEVVKGPNTALFGFNAVSGVVNIITINPLYDTSKTVEFRVGNNEFAEVSGVFSHRINDKVAFKVSAGGYRASDPHDNVKRVVLSDPSRLSFSFDLWAQINNSIQAEFEVTKNRNQRNDFIIAASTNANTTYDTGSVRGRVIADTSLGLWEVDVYHNQTRSDLELALITGVGRLYSDNSITVAKISNTFNLKRDHIFRVSGEYRNASNIFEPVDNEDLVYDIWSGSGLWDWRVNDKLRTSIGARFDSFTLGVDGGAHLSTLFPAGITPYTNDDFSQRREEYSYNIGAVYALTPQDTFRASVSRGADLPSFTEFGLQFLTAPTAANLDGAANLGDPETETSIAHNFEIGYDRKIEDINGLFRSAIFYQYNDEMQSFSSRFSRTDNFFGAGLNLDREFLGNIGDSEMYGLELSLEGQYKEHWDWGVNYTFVEINDNLRNQQSSFPYSTATEYEESNIEHIINTRIGYHDDNWHAGLFLQYRAPSKGLVPDQTVNQKLVQEDISGQFVANMNVAYDISDTVSWSVSGTSLFGDTQQSINAEVDATVWSSLKFKF